MRQPTGGATLTRRVVRVTAPILLTWCPRRLFNARLAVKRRRCGNQIPMHRVNRDSYNKSVTTTVHNRRYTAQGQPANLPSTPRATAVYTRARPRGNSSHSRHSAQRLPRQMARVWRVAVTRVSIPANHDRVLRAKCNAVGRPATPHDSEGGRHSRMLSKSLGTFSRRRI